MLSTLMNVVTVGTTPIFALGDQTRRSVVRSIIMPSLQVEAGNVARVHVGLGFVPVTTPVLPPQWYYETGFILVEGQQLDIVEQFEGSRKVWLVSNVDSPKQRVWVVQMVKGKGLVRYGPIV